MQKQDRNNNSRDKIETIFIVDDDFGIREAVRALLVDDGFNVKCFADGRGFLQTFQDERRGCLIIDALMPTMSGIDVLGDLHSCGVDLPAIMISGKPELRVAVQAMKFGAVDFIEKPFEGRLLLATIKSALLRTEAAVAERDARQAAVRRVASLTMRQREILDLVVAGQPSKNIAADLNISQRTVDNHRAAIVRKTSSKSLSSLI